MSGRTPFDVLVAARKERDRRARRKANLFLGGIVLAIVAVTIGGLIVRAQGSDTPGRGAPGERASASPALPSYDPATADALQAATARSVAILGRTRDPERAGEPIILVEHATGCVAEQGGVVGVRTPEEARQERRDRVRFGHEVDALGLNYLTHAKAKVDEGVIHLLLAWRCSA